VADPGLLARGDPGRGVRDLPAQFAALEHLHRPGTDSERVRTILQQRFGDRSDGEFLIVYRLRPGAGTAGVSLALERSIREAAKAVPGGKATALRPARGGVLYGSILTPAQPRGREGVHG
jgi:hypothetical protein